VEYAEPAPLGVSVDPNTMNPLLETVNEVYEVPAKLKAKGKPEYEAVLSSKERGKLDAGVPEPTSVVNVPLDFRNV
jgi:hypothetical protein